MRKAIIAVIALLVLAGGGYLAYRYLAAGNLHPDDLVLYGNVDIRQVDLAFKDAERVKSVLVEEGFRVTRGQLLAELETARLEAEMAATTAAVEAQQFAVQQLENGARPEEVRQAQAEEGQALAQQVLAEQTYQRQNRLRKSGANTEQEIDNAKAEYDVARARYKVAVQNRILVQKGPRWEEVAAANAALRELEARLAALQVRLDESRLYAPMDAVVRSRNLEPGDMASPQQPVFTLGIMDPKWVRAYVQEDKLGLVRPGARGYAVVDSWPDKRFEGWIGFISPTAEFTPRSVESPELRTSLVYEVRLHVHDPEGDLRLGMPVTVHLDLSQKAQDRETPDGES